VLWNCHGIIDGSGADDPAVVADLNGCSDQLAPVDVLAEHERPWFRHVPVLVLVGG
jgi:hypothetical protein